MAVKQKTKDFMLNLFFPAFCLGCRREGTYLCPDCKATLEISEYTYCLCNKHPLRLTPDAQNAKCNRCKDKKLAGLYFALPYTEKFLTKRLIHQFKYKPYLKDLAKSLADILVTHFVVTKNNTDAVWAGSVLVPVPLQKKKLKSRGYNQAEVLANELSRALQVPVAAHNLVKIKETLPQMKLSAKKRQENLQGAFLVKNPKELEGKKIFLVDDVYTTGSTMEECTRVLRQAGASQIWGITIAREA